MEPLKGWLQKKGAKGIGGGGWKRRYFRQYDDRIYYFRNEEDELSGAYGFINMADGTRWAGEKRRGGQEEKGEQEQEVEGEGKEVGYGGL